MFNVIEQFFHNISDKDAEIISKMRNIGEPKLWVEIMEKAINIGNR
jgi:hypothetical protein